MAGLVAALSRDPDVRGRGPAALARLRHMPGWEVVSDDAPTAWAGACGASGLCNIMASGACDAARAGRGRCLVAVAGDVLNRRTVAAQLALDHNTEAAALVLAAYRCWGADLFNRLEGVYAVVIHDADADLTVAGVDPRGIGTLWAVRLGDDTVLASEVKAFMVDDRFHARVDEQALAELVTLGWLSGGRCLFHGVLGLPLGYHFEVRDGGLRRVRHCDDRDLVGGTLRGEGYSERLQETAEALVGEAFDAKDVLLSLTGGLDSRLLAAAVPVGRRPACFTFGDAADSEVRVAAQVAAVHGCPHRRVPVDPAYVLHFAGLTAWLGEGRINPVSNVTGALMDRVGPGRYFVSGQGGELGRRLLKSKMMIPDWRLSRPPAAEFEGRFLERVRTQCMTRDTRRNLFGDRAAELEELGLSAARDALEGTRGIAGIDRLDLHLADVEHWEGRPWLGFAGIWIDVRAPYHTRSWVEAVLSGTSRERMDDVARLRLIARIDPAVAAVPWSLTRLPLPASARLLTSLRAVAAIGSSMDRVQARLGVGSGRSFGHAGRTRGAGLARGGHDFGAETLLSRLKRRVYPRVERREEWLRTHSWKYAEAMLTSRRAQDRGLARADGVRAILARHHAGEDFSGVIGLLLGLELWHRLFVDGDSLDDLRG